MGKYMRKGKASAEVAVMEAAAAHQPSLGVCTRARALAASAAARESSLAYLELRSRRLEKPQPPTASSKETPKSNPSQKPASQKSGRAPTSSSGSAGSSRTRERLGRTEDPSLEVEVSSGENVLEHDSRERETTPCSPIREDETMPAPGSTTKSTYSAAAKQRMQNPMHRNIPSAQEIEAFLVGLEQEQQQRFIERYNFDPANDRPLPGRYEWVEFDS